MQPWNYQVWHQDPLLTSNSQLNLYICDLWEIDHMLMYIIFYILHKVKMNDYDL